MTAPLNLDGRYRSIRYTRESAFERYLNRIAVVVIIITGIAIIYCAVQIFRTELRAGITPVISALDAERAGWPELNSVRKTMQNF